MIYFKYKYAMEGVIFILDILFHENIFLSNNGRSTFCEKLPYIQKYILG